MINLSLKIILTLKKWEKSVYVGTDRLKATLKSLDAFC